MADLQSSIPSMVDGLKPGQRKILFCAFKRNFNREAKVLEFSRYVSKHSAYHHGEQSLANTIIDMVHDYVGSNNINLLQPLGQFGTRNWGGNDAASAQYIFTKLSPETRVLFPKDDDVLLNYLNEDGQKIEPTWYMPIVPTVLVNGCEGMGTGWSTFIPNYNPRDIVANVRRLLNGESMVPMVPWYRGFKGTIEETASMETGVTYTVSGIYEEVDDTTIRIMELPIRKWTNEYKEDFLYAMSFIQGITCEGHAEDVDIDVTLSEENMKMVREEGILEKLELTTTISTSNMHLFDQKVLEEFFNLRLEYYEKRKKVMVENLELVLLKLENTVKFILGVVSGEIVVNKRKKADVVGELRERGFTPFPNKSKPVVAGATEENSEASVHGSDYDYLLSLPIASLTLEKVQGLCADRDKMNEQVEDLRKATPGSLWLKDLDSLDAQLDKLDEMDAQAEEDRKAAREKLARANGGRRATPKKATAPKKTTKKSTTEASINSAMDTAETTETSKAISVDEQAVVEVAPKKRGRKPAASKAAKPPAATRKREPAASKKQPAVGVSPEKKVRKMRASPFNKKSGSMMGNKDQEESVTGNLSSEKSQDVVAKPIPVGARRKLIVGDICGETETSKSKQETE